MQYGHKSAVGLRVRSSWSAPRCPSWPARPAADRVPQSGARHPLAARCANPLAQRPSLLAVTASDVRAPWRPVCVCTVFLRVTQRLKRRGGLSSRFSPPRRRCRSPSMPSPGSSTRLLGAPRLLGQGLSRGPSPLGTTRTPSEAPYGAGEHGGSHAADVVSVLAAVPWSRCGTPGGQHHFPDSVRHGNKDGAPAPGTTRCR